MIRAVVRNADVVISGLNGVAPRVRAYAMRGVGAALKEAYVASKMMISDTSVSLADLAAMGHPYGIEFVSKLTGKQLVARGPIPHDVMEIIHAQTGQYLADLTIEYPTGASGAIVAGRVYDLDRELDEWLQLGTSKMIARPWMRYVVREFGALWAKIVLSYVADGLKATR